MADARKETRMLAIKMMNYQTSFDAHSIFSFSFFSAESEASIKRAEFLCPKGQRERGRERKKMKHNHDAIE